MRNKIGFALLFLLGFALGLVLLSNEARAEQPTASGEKAEVAATATPTDAAATGEAATTAPKPQAPDAGKNTGPYDVTSSMEFGVRGVLIEGNGSKYRSDLNYSPGFRLFDSSLVLKAKEGTTPMLFDSLAFTTFGWGGDPNRSLRANVDKTKWYNFSANYRRLDYFRNLQNIALNQHNSNTEYRQGDFDLKLLPQNERIKFNLGYSTSRNSGPSTTTYDYQRDEFAVFAPVRTDANEYRVGADAKLWIFDLSFLQGWRYYKEDTTYSVTDSVGNNPLNQSIINTFHRDVPTRGDSPFTRLSLHTFLGRRLDFTGRYIYSNSETNFTLAETVTGKDASGNIIDLDKYTINGSTKRPTRMGDLGVTFFATDRLRVSNTFRVNNFHIDGGNVLSQALLRSRVTQFGGVTVLPPVSLDTFSLRTTKYRRWVNMIEADYDFSSRLSVHVGERHTDRHIELNSLDQTLGQPERDREIDKFDNHTDAYIFGFKARPVKMWSVYFDLERGKADNVFTRVDNYEYTNVRARSILRPTRTLSLNLSLVTRDNSNPTITDKFERFGADVNTRVYTSSVDWTPSAKFSLNSGYTRTHVTSEAEIIFFSNGVRTNGLSRYFSRDNFAFLTTFVELHPRVRLFAGYRIHKDRGQDDRVSTPSILIGSYPVQFQSPEARFSVRLHNNIDWIAGYQYFDYKEKFFEQQFYHAHLPYTSLRIYFGRRD